MSIEQGDLSKTFGNPLAGRLRRTAAPASVAPQPQVSVPTPVPPAPAPVVPSVVPPQPKKQETPQVIDTVANQQVSVYVESPVLKAIKAQRRGRTNARIVFDAIDATHDQLPALLAAKQGPAPGSLFALQGTEHHDNNPRVLWTFKATVTNIKVIDELAAQVGATSRSQLLAVALESYLLHR